MISKKKYVKIVERSSGGKPTSTAKKSYLIDDSTIINQIIRLCKDHPSVRQEPTNYLSVFDHFLRVNPLASYRNESTDSQSKSIDWFLYDTDLRYVIFKHRKISWS